VIPHNPGSKKESPVTKVTVREGETADRAIKRFKRKVEQAGILKEVRKREHYLKPSVKAKLKARAAEARARKREKRLLLNTGV
jgi:small subunit ribosomal protein S21